MVDSGQDFVSLEEGVFGEEISLDIYKVLRDRELEVPEYKGCSPQLCYRRCLVDWLSVVAKKLKLSHGIVHMAVRYMDLVMDKFEFSKEAQLTLLAVCCLWIASKLDERDDLIPSLSSLKTIVQDSYNLDDFLQMELIVMQSLDWRLLLTTAEQFIGYYLQNSISDTDLHVGYKITNHSKEIKYLGKYSLYFLEVSLQDYTFYNFLPSLISASVIASSRQCIKITPTWPAKLVQVTGYEYSDIEPCVLKFMDIHALDEIKAQSVS